MLGMVFFGFSGCILAENEMVVCDSVTLSASILQEVRKLSRRSFLKFGETEGIAYAPRRGAKKEVLGRGRNIC